VAASLAVIVSASCLLVPAFARPGAAIAYLAIV
jgi:hypothetical protein